jgi:hypothetical protein
MWIKGDKRLVVGEKDAVEEIVRKLQQSPAWEAASQLRRKVVRSHKPGMYLQMNKICGNTAVLSLRSQTYGSIP